MLSVPINKVPRIVFIRVAKAEKLVPSKKDNKKKLNTKFRVVVLGGKKKEHSELVEEQSGNPEWGFSCLLKRHQGSLDPISLLVEDSEGHQKGQVVIPMVKIGPKPYTFSPDQSPATSNNLICSELEPSSKCSNPSGFLIYWIWVEEYCQEQDATSRSSFNKSMTSLFGSKHTLGSSKSRLSFPAGSTSNISSGTTLNKPESHKKTLSFLHIKSKKDKNKKSVPEAGKSPESSDVDEYNEPGNPFEVGGKVSGNPFDNFTGTRVPVSAVNIDRDRTSGSSNGSIFENHSLPQHGDTTQSHPYNSNMAPVTLPPIPKTRTSPPKLKVDDTSAPTTLLGKSNLANRQSANLNLSDSSPTLDVKASPDFLPGHKSNNESINSLFSEHIGNTRPVPLITEGKDETDFSYKGNPVSEFQPGLTSMTPETMPPAELDLFKKPFSKPKEKLKVDKSPVIDKSPRSSTHNPFVGRDTYQKDFVPSSPSQNQSNFKFIPSSEYSTSNEQSWIQNSPTAIKVPEYASSVTSITPVTLPPFDSETLTSRSPLSARDSIKSNQSPVLTKPNRPTNSSFRSNQDNLSRSHADQRYQPLANDEADNLRKENSELKSQQSKSQHRITDLQSELDYVKDCLFKLRTRLLEEGATEFLEKL